MSQYCALLARRHGLDEDRCELIRIASPMHDIGKIGTPDNILLKPGKFTPEEFQAISRHPEIGYRILSGSDADLLKLAAVIAWTHHEKYDGSGYPRKLVGEAIPLEGRIAAVADAFDALTSRRVYKPSFPVEQAIKIMRQGREKHFDPGLLDTFLGAMDEVLVIKEQYADL
jgi:putative two-component system response regulator